MKKLFEFVKKISNRELNQKLIIKVTAGILLLVVAFTIYWGKTKNESSDSITINPPLESAEDEKEQSKAKDVSENDKFIYIDVTGAVKKPSVVKILDGSRVFEAIELAGGITSDGESKFLNLAAKLTDGTQVYVPTKQEVSEQETANTKGIGNHAETSYIGSSSNPTSSSYNNKDNTSNSGLVNINTADSTELQKLTGVGPSTAEKIISYRNNFGKFEKIEDLKNVSGIGDKTFEKLRDKICIN